MAIVQSSALVVRNGDANGSATLTGVTAGNAIVVTCAAFAGGKASNHFTFKDGTTSLSVADAFTPGGNYSSAAVAWELNVAAGSHTITVAPTTASTACYIDFVVHEVSGLGTTQPSVSTSGTTTGATLALSGATPAQNGCIVFSAIADDANASSSTSTATTPSGYTSLWSEMAGNTSQVGAAAYQIQTTAAPVAPSWTGLNAGGGAGWAAVAVAFAPAGASTNTASGSASVSASAAAAATSTNPAAASASVAPSAQGSATNAGQLVASGNASVAPTASGGATLTLSAAGKATIAPAASGGASELGISQVLAYASKADPNQPSTTSPLITAGITTPESGSTIIVNLLTQSTSTAPVSNFSDSYGNTWTLVATNYYAGGTAGNGEFPSYLLKCVNAKGGPNHTFQLTKNSTQDECTIYAVVLNGGDIGNWTANTTGTYSGSVTTSGPNSTVLSFWSPNDTGVSGYVDNYHAPAGWVQMANNNNAYNSMSGADAYLSPVAASGTAVTATWTADNTGGGINPGQCMYMVEVTAPAGGSTIAASGSSSATPTAKGAAASTNAASGSSSVSLIAAGTALAVLLAQGSASVSPAAQGSAQIIDPAAVSAVVAPSAKGSALAALTASASALVSPSAKGAATATLAATGSAAASPSAGGSATNAGHIAANGSASVSPTTTVSAASTLVAAGSTAVLPSATGATVSTATASGNTSVSPSASGYAATTLSAFASVSVAPTASGSAIQAGLVYANGSASVAPSTKGEAVSINSAQASAKASLAGSGAAVATLPAVAVASASPIAYGTVTISFVAAQGNASVTPALQGLAVSTLTASARALIAPVASGTAYIGNALTTNPQFYLQMPARAFYLQMPARSFYISDTESMAAQTFPAAMDPLETQVLTIDKTPDLMPGEILTGLSGALQIMVVRGSDSAASTRFGVPQINAASIAAEPPAIPAAIAAGMGLQIECTDPQDACWYLCRQACTTSAGRILVLKGILTVTSQ